MLSKLNLLPAYIALLVLVATIIPVQVALATNTHSNTLHDDNNINNFDLAAKVEIPLVSQADRRLLRNDGELGHRCSRRFGCNTGLECVPAVQGLSFCLPLACMQDVLSSETQDVDWNSFHQQVLDSAGVDEESLLSSTSKTTTSTTTSNNVDTIHNASTAIQQALTALTEEIESESEVESLPVNLGHIQSRLAQCANANIISSRNETTEDDDDIIDNDSNSNSFTYRATYFETAGLVRYREMTVQAPSTDTPQRVCWGGGPDVGFSYGFAFGLICGDNVTQTVFEQTSFGFDVDVTSIIGFGYGAGLYLRPIHPYLEVYLAVGIGGGMGINVCNEGSF